MNPMSGCRARTSWTRVGPHRPVPIIQAKRRSGDDIAVLLEMGDLEALDLANHRRLEARAPGLVAIGEGQGFEPPVPLRARSQAGEVGHGVEDVTGGRDEI